jgi:FkbM family methyltransferase
MEKYYSQHGEDFLINKIFNGKKNGFYVEIGCLDGIEYSNTYFFEKKGWNGICVEAHKDFIEMLRKNRSQAQIVHCAVGEKDQDDVTFYANKLGSLSTLDKNEEERWKQSYSSFFTGFEEQHVKMRTLTTIFDESNVKEIDFISLDIEGYEVQALTGLDLKKYRPRLFIIEYKDEDHKAKLESILFPNEYKFLATLGCNLFYGTEVADKKILNGNYGTQDLIFLDEKGNELIRKVEISQPSAMKKLRHKLSNIKRRLSGK